MDPTGHETYQYYASSEGNGGQLTNGAMYESYYGAQGYSSSSTNSGGLTGDMLAALNPSAAPAQSTLESPSLKLKFSKDVLKKSGTATDELVKITVKKSGGQNFALGLLPFPDTSGLRRLISPMAQAETMEQVDQIPTQGMQQDLEQLQKLLSGFQHSVSVQLDSWDTWRQEKRKIDDFFQQKKRHKKEYEEDEDNDSDYEEDMDVIEDYVEDSKPLEPKRAHSRIDKPKKDADFHGSSSSSANKPPNRDRRGRHGRSENYYNEDDIDLALGLGKKGKPNFWTDMETYFGIPSQEDLSFLQPHTLEPDDEVYQIPPRGRYYRDIWKEEDATDPDEPLKAVASRKSFYDDQDFSVAAPLKLTQKLLASLITELKSNPSEFNSSDSMIYRKDTEESCIPLDVPATYDFSRTAILTLEDRVKLELKSIGLLDPSDYEGAYHPSRSGEDEIYNEILNLQKQLKEQITVNNIQKQRLLNLVPAMISSEEKLRKERQSYVQYEKQYLKITKKKKKSKN